MITYERNILLRGDFVRHISFDDLSEQQKKLLAAAEEAMGNAYSPYYKFHVGAAILTKGGEIFTGANFEEASGSSICAERAAILKANSNGKRTYESIAIIARGESYPILQPSAPCGSCRQMIYEEAQLSDKDLEIILSNTNKDKIIITTINELLPMAFGPKDMGIDIEKYKK